MCKRCKNLEIHFRTMLSIFSFKTSTPLKKLFLSICRDILCNCANIWPKEHKYARLKSDLMKEEFTRIRTIGPPNWRLVYQNEREMLIKIWTTKMEFCHYLPINWLWCKGPGKCPCLRVWPSVLDIYQNGLAIAACITLINIQFAIEMISMCVTDQTICPPPLGQHHHTTGMSRSWL